MISCQQQETLSLVTGFIFDDILLLRGVFWAVAVYKHQWEMPEKLKAAVAGWEIIFLPCP